MKTNCLYCGNENPKHGMKTCSRKCTDELKKINSREKRSCLFCKSDNVAVIANLSSDKTGEIKNWYVECRKCFATGSKAKTQNDAVAYWNREPQYLEDNTTPNIFEQ